MSPCILIVDPDRETLQWLATVLQNAGFCTEEAEDPLQARRIMRRAKPGMIVLELGHETELQYRLLHEIRSDPTTSQLPIIALGADDEQADESDISRAFDAGADEFLRKPLRAQELLARIRNLFKMREAQAELARKQADAEALLELTQALSSSAELHDTLHGLVRRVAEVVQVDRVSIVVVPQALGEGFVVASSEDMPTKNLAIDLPRYPEIQYVLKQQKTILIEDAQNHPLLRKCREAIKKRGVQSICALPISWRGQTLAALTLRSVTAVRPIGAREQNFCQTIANATAVALRNARVMQSLVDRTRRLHYAAQATEKRIKALQLYADFFASASDGLVAADVNGKLLFANPRAHEIVGMAADELIKQPLKKFVHVSELERARRIWKGFSEGRFPQNIDLKLNKHDGSTIVVNASFASLQDNEGAVLFSFRDVTQERATAVELVKTKDFLESLVNATPDAIIAADPDGNIILFNNGAEHITKYRSTEVLHQMNIRELHPEDGYEQIKEKLASRGLGGIGRIDSARIDIVDKDGVRIPASLSVATIYENGEPTATCGIYRDLRERMRIEKRLASAQHRLEISDRQAIAAELAGTAAHELNQPLMSIMAYAQWLQRAPIEDAKAQEAVATIIDQVERMANIVQKIGEITEYETKSYVGGQRILDLDKAVLDAKRNAK